MVGAFNDVPESTVFLWACCNVVWEFSDAPCPCLENQEALFSLMTLNKGHSLWDKRWSSWIISWWLLVCDWIFPNPATTILPLDIKVLKEECIA